jgi:hypothetical protein
MQSVIQLEKGKIIKECIGRVTCSKYEGEFSTPELASKAATGRWYASVSGNPYVIEGEGSTPVWAIRNAIARTKDRIRDMETGLNILQESEKCIQDTIWLFDSSH